jgi:hypothetical protein
MKCTPSIEVGSNHEVPTARRGWRGHEAQHAQEVEQCHEANLSHRKRVISMR